MTHNTSQFISKSPRLRPQSVIFKWGTLYYLPAALHKCEYHVFNLDCLSKFNPITHPRLTVAFEECCGISWE